jgi:Tfp pilus assembly protein PilO
MSLNVRIQQIVYAVLVAAILLNIPLYLIFVRPEIEASSEGQVRIDSMRQQLMRRARTLNALKEIQVKLNHSRVKYDKFERDFLFSYSQGTSELLEELDGVCSEAGLLRNRVTYRMDSEQSFGMQRLGITLPIEGTYANIRTFINILENTSKFIIVDSMALVSEREGTGVLRLDVNLSTLFVARP